MFCFQENKKSFSCCCIISFTPKYKIKLTLWLCLTFRQQNETITYFLQASWIVSLGEQGAEFCGGCNEDMRRVGSEC
jgi:hypothetical protein